MTQQFIFAPLTSVRLISGLGLFLVSLAACSGKSVQLEEEDSTGGEEENSTEGESASGGMSAVGPTSCQEKLYFEEFSEPYAQSPELLESPDYVSEGFGSFDHGERFFQVDGYECGVFQPNFECKRAEDCPASTDPNVSPSCVGGFCRIFCESSDDCPSVLACVDDRDGNMTCALPRDPYGELDLVPSLGSVCELRDCADFSTQEDCEATLVAGEHYHAVGCVWVEERIFHENGANCEEEEARGSCHVAGFVPGANATAACDETPIWADYGGGTVSLITSTHCNYALDAQRDEFGESSGECDPSDPTRPAVCDCACE